MSASAFGALKVPGIQSNSKGDLIVNLNSGAGMVYFTSIRKQKGADFTNCGPFVSITHLILSWNSSAIQNHRGRRHRARSASYNTG